MISNEELLNIYGGINYLVVGAIVTVITLLIGVADGYYNPTPCNHICMNPNL